MGKLSEQVAALEAEVERLRDMRDFYKSARDELINARDELAERLYQASMSSQEVRSGRGYCTCHVFHVFDIQRHQEPS